MTVPPTPEPGPPGEDPIVEAWTAAVWYGRADARADRFWPPWTLRRRREHARVCGHHADAAFDRLQALLGEHQKRLPVPHPAEGLGTG